MPSYLSIMSVIMKEGRPYIFSTPQGSQDWSEVFAALDDIKKEIEQMELSAKQAGAPTETVDVSEKKE